MRRKISFIIIILLFSQYIYADKNDLLDEYNLLYTDLLNFSTWGYKSFFDYNSYQANENINISQGSIQITDVPTHFAILGEGFFKIRLENNLIGYTRNGAFTIDLDGNIRTQKEGYFLYENIHLGESFLPEISSNTIINGALEMSNYSLLPVILRMFYILSVLDETLIINIEFKKELIKFLINELSKNITTIQEIDNRINFLGYILPFIKYDY